MPKSICIVGNSVSLLVRPPRSGPHEKTYAEILRDRGFSIVHSGKQAVLAADLYHYLEDEVVRHFPDYVVIHFGIVDCTSRARPRWLQHFFNLNDWSNSVVGSAFISQGGRILRIVLRRIYRSLIERTLYALGLSWRWLSVEDFKLIYLDVIQRLFLDTPVKKVLLVGITPVSDELERRVAGTRANAKIYNTVMRSISLTTPDTQYIDADTQEFANLTVDGIHLTARGHELLARHIEASLLGERVDYAAQDHGATFSLENKLRKWLGSKPR